MSSLVHKLSELPKQLGLLRQVGIYIIYALVSQSVSFFLAQQLSKQLGQAVVGQHYLLLTFVTSCLVLTPIAAITVLIREFSSAGTHIASRARQYLRKTLWLMAVQVGIISIGSWYLAGALGLLPAQLTTHPVFGWVLVYMVFYGFETLLTATLTGLREYAWLLGLVVIRLLLLFMLLTTQPLTLLLAWQYLVAGSGCLIAGMLIRLVQRLTKPTSVLPPGPIPAVSWRMVLTDIRPFFIASLFVSPSLFLSNRMLGGVAGGLAAVGFYNICKQFATLNGLLIMQATQSLFPYLNEAYQTRNWSSYRRLRRNNLYMGLGVAALGILLLAGAGPLVLFGWYGWPRTPFYFAAYTITIASSVLVFLNQYVGGLLVIEGHQVQRMWADIALSVSLVVVCRLLIPAFTRESIFTANFTSLVVAVGYTVYQYQRLRRSVGSILVPAIHE